MPDVETYEPKKIIVRKKHLGVVNILKESIRAITISKHILDLRINLTVSQLLVSSPAVEKQLIKAITKDEGMQF